jgi:hypothetical protein
MTTRTQGIWSISDPILGNELKATIDAEINILVSQGKTDGLVERVPGPESNQVTYIRNWTTLQDAEDWLIFVNALEVPPVSTAILPD